MDAITGVWAANFYQEMDELDELLHSFPIIAFDTEFPGFIRDTPREALETQRYQDVKFNVGSLKLIQLGLTLSDSHGNIGGTWEFNFSDFSETSDPHVEASISPLKKNGLDFDKIWYFGIPVEYFVARFCAVLKTHRRYLKWVCFHGLYDMAYLLKLLTGQRPLPGSVDMFARALGLVFGTNIYDVKYMARHCPGLFGGEIGLARVANILNVERSGEAHQAGSDSLLTAAVFSKMNRMFRSAADMSRGCLYGISPITVKPNPPRHVVIHEASGGRYWQPLQQAPPMLVAGTDMIHHPSFHFAAPRRLC